MSLIYFIIVMCIIVVIHEIGHLVAAKIFGVYCYEFSVGMGPKIFSRKGKETIYSLRFLPLGGYVQMAGEADAEQGVYADIDVPKERSIQGIASWKKIVILFAGALMNFVLAWILVSGVLISVGRYPVPAKPIVESVIENSAAEEAGFRANDEIIKVVFEDGTVIKPKGFDDFALFTQTYGGQITFTVIRGTEELELKVQGREQDGVYLIGIARPPQEYTKVNFLNGFKYGADYLGEISRTMIKSLSRLIQGNGLDQLSGPVGIYQATAQQVQFGWINMILWIAILSLNIGIFNLLPLPALDGGRIILAGFEWITGKPINKKIETALIVGSMLLLILMIILVTGQDILRLF